MSIPPMPSKQSSCRPIRGLPCCAAGPAGHPVPVCHCHQLGAVEVLNNLANELRCDPCSCSSLLSCCLGLLAACCTQQAPQAACRTGGAASQQAMQQAHSPLALCSCVWSLSIVGELVQDALHLQAVQRLLDVGSQARGQRRAACAVQQDEALLQHTAALCHLPDVDGKHANCGGAAATSTKCSTADTAFALFDPGLVHRPLRSSAMQKPHPCQLHGAMRLLHALRLAGIDLRD